MKIAITGSTGHIASSLIPLLIQNNYQVRALIYEQQLQFNLSNIEIVKGNISQPASLVDFVSGCEVVIHCAAKISINSDRDPSVYETNVGGTKNIFIASKNAGVKKFIYVSSIHAYEQRPSDKLLDETGTYCVDKAWGYDRSKRDAERFVLQNLSAAMEIVVVNPTGVVGPFDHKPSLMGQAIMDIYNKKVPSLIKGGFDLCDVRDVANGIMLAIEKGRNGHSYFLSGEWTSLADMHMYIMQIKNEKQFLPVLPGWAALAGLPFIKLMAIIKKQEPLYTKESLYALLYGNKNVSNSKAKEELGYYCRPISKTIIDAINWYRQVGLLL